MEPATSAFFRCAWALPVLALVALWERRRGGRRTRRERFFAFGAGVFFAVDLELWHHAIAQIGAGLSAVIANMQVLVVALVAWAIHGERPTARAATALPAALIGVTLISGVVGASAYGASPALGVLLSLGTAVAYSGYLLLLRAANPRADRPAGAAFDSTLVCAVVLLPIGAALGELHLTPTWPAHGWLVLLALSAQAFAGIAIATALPRLPAVTTSILLLLQPGLSVLMAALIVAERPSAIQVAGVLVVLAAVLYATTGRTVRTAS